MFLNNKPHCHFLLTVFRMDLLGTAHGWGASKRPLVPKICHTYPTMMKLGTGILYLKKFKNIYKSSETPLKFCRHSIFSPENSNLCHIKKYRYRLHFNT